MVEPILLSDTIATTNDALVKATSAVRMTPPSNRPMLVRDIGFTVHHPSPTLFRNPCLFQSVKIEAGRFAMTHGFIPMWLLASVPDKMAETLSDNGAVPSRISSRLRWILPKPMYLPPNTQIRFTFRQDDMTDLAAPYDSGVEVSVRGLLLDSPMRGGRQIYGYTEVPYVSGFVPSVGQNQSGQQDLCNVLDKPIKVQRLVGRIAWMFDLPDEFAPLLPFKAVDAIGTRGCDPNIGTDPAQSIPHLVKVRLRDGNGLPLTSSQTDEYLPFWTLFPPGGNAWTIQHALQPNEHISATIQRPSRLVTLTRAAVQPMISLVGSRMERI